MVKIGDRGRNSLNHRHDFAGTVPAADSDGLGPGTGAVTGMTGGGAHLQPEGQTRSTFAAG